MNLPLSSNHTSLINNDNNITQLKNDVLLVRKTVMMTVKSYFNY